MTGGGHKGPPPNGIRVKLAIILFHIVQGDQLEPIILKLWVGLFFSNSFGIFHDELPSCIGTMVNLESGDAACVLQS